MLSLERELPPSEGRQVDIMKKESVFITHSGPSLLGGVESVIALTI